MSQRHANRRGWLRNRRAVTLDDDGLVIEPWLGRPRRIPWADVRAVRWLDSHRAEVQAWRGRVVLDEGLGRLPELVEAIEQRVEAESAEQVRGGPDAETIERWLGGERDISLVLPNELRPRLIQASAFGGAMMGLATGGILIDSRAGLILWPVCGLFGYGLGAALGRLVAPLVMTLLERLGFPGELLSLRLLVDGHRLACHRPGERERSFRWNDLTDAKLCADGWRLRFGHGDRRPLVLPDHAVLQPVITTAHHVLEARRAVPVEDQPISEAALSRATGEAEADDRGLSLSEQQP